MSACDLSDLPPFWECLIYIPISWEYHQILPYECFLLEKSFYLVAWPYAGTKMLMQGIELPKSVGIAGIIFYITLCLEII